MIIERPFALYGLIFLVPATVMFFQNYRKLIHFVSEKKDLSELNQSAVNKIIHAVVLRFFFRSFSWICFVCAFAGFSWGTIPVPIQKNGHAVSFVFDISWSMTAKDAPGGDTRLDSAKAYADLLLTRMTGATVSVVLAKGDAITAIPQTEDIASVKTLIKMLSPSLMSSIGSSPGQGVETAISSFPVQSDKKNEIWVFTDGEESDGKLQTALENALRYGIDVTIIGFGSDKPTEILAGDGKTRVKTSLQSTILKKMITSVEKYKSGWRKSYASPEIRYIVSSDAGSALKILHNFFSSQNSKGESDVSYELKPIRRQDLFLFVGILFFIVSFIFSEIDIKSVMQRIIYGRYAFFLLMILPVFFLSGCTKLQENAVILQSTWEWQLKRYRQATAGFLKAVDSADERNSSVLKQYALMGLASTYLMQNENALALKRLDQISSDIPSSLQFAVLYNKGIVAHRSGDYKTAVNYFKQALLIDGTNVNAKINLELSLDKDIVQSKKGEQEVKNVSVSNQDDILEKDIFSVVQENDTNQWKKHQSNSAEKSEVDY